MRAEITDWKDPDYTGIFKERKTRLAKIRADEAAGLDAWTKVFHYYEDKPWEWVEDWCFTYDPRRVAQNRASTIPFMLFPKQREFLAWLLDRLQRRESGVVEKSRDVGITWLMAAFGVWAWVFKPGSAISFGSYIERKVDRMGDMDSIFEKARFIVRNLPREMRPAEYDEKRDARYMNFTNRENGSTMIGEAGINVGRGGRSTVYFVDEFAHFEHDDAAEASLSQNADVRIYASTVKGTGNLFYRKRHDGVHPVFVFDWKDDPRKGPEWYAKQKAELEPEILAQEVDRDYHASIERVVIRGPWVEAAREITKYVRVWPRFNFCVGGLDVGAGGSGKSVLCPRWGAFVDHTDVWNEADTTNVATLAYHRAVAIGVKVLNYDAIGVGAGVAAALNRMADEGKIKINGVTIGDPPSDDLWPEGKSSKEKFRNMRAEVWWKMRDRFRKTYEHLCYLQGIEGGIEHPLDELIVLDPTDSALVGELTSITWDSTTNGKIQIESKRDLKRRGIKSPDHAEALSLTFVNANPVEMEASEIGGMF